MVNKDYFGEVMGKSVFSRGNYYCNITTTFRPRVGSGVVRMDPLRFLAGCRTRRLNQA